MMGELSKEFSDLIERHNKAMEILSNVKNWDACPQEYQDTIKELESLK